MEAVTVSTKYQVVIPREVRDQFNVRPGDKLLFIPYKNTLRVIIVPPLAQARGLFKGINTEYIREEEDEER